MQTTFWLENSKEKDHLETAYRWEDNTKIYLTEIGWNVDGIPLDQEGYQGLVLVNLEFHD
jgi:hypothetical protein